LKTTRPSNEPFHPRIILERWFGSNVSFGAIAFDATIFDASAFYAGSVDHFSHDTGIRTHHPANQPMAGKATGFSLRWRDLAL
jgi:hypothetical protein